MSYKYSTIGEFDSTQEDLESYVKRVNLYFVTNDIDDAAKKSSDCVDQNLPHHQKPRRSKVAISS